MTQQQVADAVGVRQATVSAWEAATPERATEPAASHVASLATLFRVSADYILGLTSEPTALPPGHWIIDMGIVHALRNSERVTDMAWACPIPEQCAIVSAAEFNALRREVEQLVAHPPRKKRR